MVAAASRAITKRALCFCLHWFPEQFANELQLNVSRLANTVTFTEMLILCAYK